MSVFVWALAGSALWFPSFLLGSLFVKRLGLHELFAFPIGANILLSGVIMANVCVGFVRDHWSWGRVITGFFCVETYAVVGLAAQGVVLGQVLRILWPSSLM